MTGIYLFGKDADGKRIPKEIEYLTREELDARFLKSNQDDTLDFLEAVCSKLVEVEAFMKSEGYVAVSDLDTEEAQEDKAQEIDEIFSEGDEPDANDGC